jgi:hypothetical protein
MPARTFLSIDQLRPHAHRPASEARVTLDKIAVKDREHLLDVTVPIAVVV